MSAKLVAQIVATEAGRLTSWSLRRQDEFANAVTDALVLAFLVVEDRYDEVVTDERYAAE